MRIRIVYRLLLPLSLGASGCDRGSPDARDAVFRTAAREMSPRLAVSAAAADSAIQPVDFRALRDLLPARLPGLQRTSATGERSGMPGMALSRAIGEYRGEANGPPASAYITIIDLAATRGAPMTGYAWLMMEIDRESGDGFERTTRIRDHPAHEKFTGSGDVAQGRIQVVVARRFVVEIAGIGLEMERIRTALDLVDLSRLDSLAAAVN